MKYYAKVNRDGFANSWYIKGFTSRTERDAYVEKTHVKLQYKKGGICGAYKIKKRNIPAAIIRKIWGWDLIDGIIYETGQPEYEVLI